MTPYENLNRVLNALTDGISLALGEQFVGFYLQGSFAVGDFDEHSDCDFIAATRRELSAEEVASLNALHDRIFHLPHEWAKHLEGSYFSEAALLAPPSLPLWYLDHGSSSLIRSDHCNTLVVRSILERHAITLYGPPAKTLVNPVPTAALKDEIRQTMHSWGHEILANPRQYANRFYQGYIVLNYCRMWHDLETGRVGSKTAGANWAKG